MPKDKIPILTCKVVGVMFEGRQQILRDLIKGRPMLDISVRLVPEPDNAYDPNAVKVMAPGNAQIGYIPREAAEDVLRALESGMIHERQQCTIGRTSKKNGGSVYWGTLQVFQAAGGA